MSLGPLMYWLQNDGGFVFWLAYSASACAISYAVGKERAYKAWLKHAKKGGDASREARRE